MMQIPPELRAKVEGASNNELLPPVSTGGGIDLVDVMGKARRSVNGVVIPLEIKPSSQSLRLLQQQANAFQQQAENKGFDQAAKDAGYKVIADAPPALKKGAPIFSSPAFVAWIFNAKKGDVSAPLKIADAKATIVAQLTDIQEAGPQPIEQVKPQIKSAIVQTKAVNLAAARAQRARAAIGQNGDIAAGAAALGDTTAKPLTLSLGPAESVSGLPQGEYVVNNAAFSMKPGQVSEPLKGQNGYYIAKLIDVKPATDDMLKAQKQTLLSSLLQEKRQRFFMTWLENRKASAAVVDYREHRQ
jgi:parvulin-like peptidyl-prolyl isomerase